MEKTLGELFNDYCFLYCKFEKSPEDINLASEMEPYKEAISSRIGYLDYNLELNILINYLLRANREYYSSYIMIETYMDEWLEYSEEIAVEAKTLKESIDAKEKYVKKINEFIRKYDEHRL